MITESDPGQIAPEQRTSSPWAPRSLSELVRDQVAALDAWNRAHQVRAQAREVSNASREMRLDLARRLEVRQREQAALLERAEQHMRDTEVCLGSERPRAVLAHRNEWFRDKLAARLEDNGVRVLASVEDGASASAALVLDQPDLLLVEELLPNLSGSHLADRAREFAPRTLIGAQAMTTEGMEGMLAAGARAVFSRRIPPAMVADELVACLLGNRDSVRLA